jgi:ABC-type transport system substrate-binding protein
LRLPFASLAPSRAGKTRRSEHAAWRARVRPLSAPCRCFTTSGRALPGPARWSPDINSLDPQQPTDLYSTRVAIHIFEALYPFDHFAVPAKVIPSTAEAMPAVTDGGKTWTIRLQKGIHFADDPVVGGCSNAQVALRRGRGIQDAAAGRRFQNCVFRSNACASCSTPMSSR